jgi:dihydrofolate synthase/folylpolyglutamate synthase
VTYLEVLERLFAARRAGIVLGLDRVDEVLARLDRPERRIGVVAHIGGTNGKGSTAAMIASIGAAAGRRVAVYSSPHLSTLRERMVCGGRMIEEAEVVAAAEATWAAGADALTFFEQITVIALWWFAAQRPDLTVLEVGLGGRLDATNVVDAEVAAVTGVAMDHEAMLGGTLDALAGEKAGIFKRGRRAVIGCSGEPAAIPTLIAGAKRAGVSRLTLVDGEAPVALPGAHQRRNAAGALAVVDHLEALGALSAPSWIRARGLATVRHPGRLEVIGHVVLDGAHTPHGAAALAAALADVARPRTLILALSADKDVAAMLAPLVPVVDTLIATRYQQPRALSPADLASAARTAGFADVSEAPDVASALATATGTVIIAGSLMLVGEARVLLMGAPADPMVVTDPAPPGP